MAKLKIGVFGAYRGMTMVNVLLNHPDAELVAVCDKFVPALEKAGKTAKDVGLNIALYESFDEFFKHDMDAVVLANYANEHAPFAIRLLKSGRHVLSEVLPCETIQQGIELIEAVEESGLVYAYAENYCYMDHTFEMRRRYENGDIGDIMYAEGEYVHDCAGIWPSITYGERSHWRNNLFPNFYCTHSIGPILTISGRRPVRVSGFITQRNLTVPPLGLKSGEVGAVEMLTLDNGAIVKSVHGHLKREPGSVNYEVYGTKGSMESQRFPPSYQGERPDEIQVYMEGDTVCQGTMERYTPQKFVDGDLAKKYSTHGGSDFYATHFFIQKILGREDGMHYSIDVYTAIDMGICGILAYRSALNGNAPMEIPNLRNPDEREKWRNDTACTNPAIAGDQLLPCYPSGNMEYPDEVFEKVRNMWLEEYNA
ncbi:MAG: Gfo/Idh/MocA family oxidoreductase [Clostridia bacterium]|nr:Gfo/Idh/MocA family oxidoreductase [Clostridia bacterium]MBQ4157891.1 Gfo/Idh/MocA family oxidoreductase [Clostridia bacterium]